MSFPSSSAFVGGDGGGGGGGSGGILVGVTVLIDQGTNV